MGSFVIQPARGGSIVSIAVAAGGERIAVALGREIQLVDGSGQLLARGLTDETSGTMPVALTASGAVVGGVANVVYVLDGQGCRRIEGKFDPSRSPIMEIAEVAPGIVITGHGDGAIRRVDLAAGKFERTGYKAHKRRLRMLTRGARPGTFFTGAEDHFVAEWHESDRAPKQRHENVGTAWAIDAEGRRALVQIGREALGVRDLAAGSVAPLPARQLVPIGAFGADGTLAVSSTDDEVVVLDRDGAVIARHREPDRVSALAIDGSALVVARGLAVSTLAVVAARRVLRREIRTRHARPIARLVPLASGFASHAGDDAVKQWSDEGAFLGGVRLSAGTIHDIASKGTALLVATSRGELLRLDATTHAILDQVVLGTTRAWSVAGPDDGSWIAGTNLDHEAARFARGKTRATWRRGIGRAHRLLWSEGRRRFLLQHDGRLEFLDEHGETIGEIAVDAVWPGASISPDGRHVAAWHPVGATVHSLDVIGDPPRTLAVATEGEAKTSALAWASDDALWIARSHDAFRVSLEGGGTTRTVRHAARITAMLDLAGPLALGDERGEVAVIHG